MQKLSDEKKRISRVLVNGPKTIEDLAKELSMPYAKLSQELKEMLSLKLVSKQGYPTKYSLKTGIMDSLKERKEIEAKDLFKIRLRPIIEMQAIEEELLKKQLGTIESLLRKEDHYTIYDLKTAGIEKQGEYYSSFIDVNFSVRDFRAMVRFVFFYGPTAVEVLKPEKIELKSEDLQDALVQMSSLVQAYADEITRLMNRKELEEFHQSLYSK